MTAKTRRPARRRTRGGALLLLSLLLVGSATLRLGVQAGPALAKELAGHAGTAVEPAQHAVSGAPTGSDLQALLDAFQAREKTLRTRELQVEDRMRALEIADAAIEAKLAELVAAEERLSTTLAMAEGASEGDLAQLTSLYEKMKPKDAAALFEEMDPQFAAGFLSRMRPEIAAGVMAGLSPKAAYTISVVLAGRNAMVPKE